MLDGFTAFVGHRVHVVRSREVGTLLDWAGDLQGKRLLDVAGGDGYWAAQAQRKGAAAVNVDIARPKLVRGKRYDHAPAQVEGDALALPFADATFDVVLSVCAIEHFDDGGTALAEMARVLRPGGRLVLSADTLSRAARWPELDAAHRRRYHVKSTYTHERLADLLAERGLDVQRHSYLFRSSAAERLYLTLSAKGTRVGWNAAAPLTPLVAVGDRLAPNTRGSIVLIDARRRAPAA